MRSDKDILIVCVFTFITVVTWVFIDLVKATKTPTITNISEELLAPLPGNIDESIFEDLETRHAYE